MCDYGNYPPRPYPRYEEEGEVQHLRAQVRDLKARLRACREAYRAVLFIHCDGCPDGEPQCAVCSIANATDLRVRDWRKP